MDSLNIDKFNYKIKANILFDDESLKLSDNDFVKFCFTTGSINEISPELKFDEIFKYNIKVKRNITKKNIIRIFKFFLVLNFFIINYMKKDYLK